MLPSQTCASLSASLEHMRALKQVFETAFENAVLGDMEAKQEAQRSKKVLEIQMSQLRTEISAWEKIFIETQTTQILSSLLQKKRKGLPLNKYELCVLYGLYKSTLLPKDLLDWRRNRNHEEDFLILFDEYFGQIARSMNQINPSTKAYIGKLEQGVFDHLPQDIEHIFTNFPEGHLRYQRIKIGGKDADQLKEILAHNRHHISSNAKQMIENDDFKRSLREPNPNQPDWTQWNLKSPEEITLVRVRVADLGFPDGATTDQIYTRVVELGLELCSPEVGPQFRLKYVNQPLNERIYIGARPIRPFGADKVIFSVEYDEEDGSWLNYHWAGSTERWSADSEFVFRLRKSVQPVALVEIS